MAGREGRLDEVAFMEMIAQSYAAFNGYMDLVEGKLAGAGFLVESATWSLRVGVCRRPPSPTPIRP